ncbi:unnamed protein product [Dovyalis caffra]|uniref:Uncharacterized protein n=1 Tax=Dovyalis caffra TaxID=77055 RepID=A0AAV1S6W0_9ROSI|nr:unnamed protein product [Dovyalis caffra]
MGKNSDRIKGLPAIRDESVKSNDKRRGKSSEVTAEVAAPVSPALGSQHGVIEDEETESGNADDVYGGFGGAHCMIKRGTVMLSSLLGKDSSFT